MGDLQDQLIGVRLGNFTITGQLGRGGMGVVYAAQHATLPTRAAVKVLLAEYARDADLVRRFLDEAHVASSINDPNVVRVFDAGMLDDGRPYLVMELLEGSSLHALLASGPVAIGRAIVILRQVAGALATVHRHGIIHRDLKPENVHLGKSAAGADAIKVLDFGLAKTQGMESGLTSAGTVVGTPDFMSPEQAQGRALDLRSDVYSFGCVAYATLTGGPPFTADSAIGVLLAHVGTPPPDVRTRRADCPAALAQLVAQCMNKATNDRPASMEAVITSLDQIARDDQSFGATAAALPTISAAQLASIGSAATAAISTSGTNLAPPPGSNPSGINAASISGSGMAHAATKPSGVPLFGWVAAALIVGVAFAAFALKNKAPSAPVDTVTTTTSASASVAAPAPSALVYPEDHNPFKVTDLATVAAGKAIWVSKCVRCHGARGDGAGSDIPKGARPKAFSDVVLPPGTLDVYYYGILRHGVERGGGEAMPSFAKKLDIKESWEVVTFLNMLRPKMKWVDVEAELKAGPPPETATCVVRGEELYQTRCSTCHGDDGGGEGPASSLLPDPPTDLKEGSWNAKNVRKGEPDLQHVFRIMTTGSGEYMGKFSSISTDDRWSLARYVVSMRKAALHK